MKALSHRAVVLLLALALAALSACRGGGAADVQPKPNPLSADLLFDILLSDIAGLRGEHEVEVEAITRAARKSGDPTLLAHAALSALHAGKYSEALASALLWQQAEPAERAPGELIARIYLRLGRPQDAERQFTMLLARAGAAGQGEQLRSIARALVQAGAARQYLALYRNLLARHADNADGWFGKAVLANRAGDNAAAEDALRRALQLQPDFGEAAAALMDKLRHNHRTEELQKFAADFLRRNPGDTELRMQFADSLLSHGRREQALRQYAEVTVHDPDHVKALFAVAVLSRGRDDKTAVKNFARVLEVEPRRDDARYYLAEMEYANRHYRAATRLAWEVTDVEYYLDAQLLLGAAIAKTRGADAGLKFLRAVPAGGERHRVRWFMRQEQILAGEKRYPEARKLLDQALREFPDNGELLYARGLVAAHLKLVDLHERDLRKLIRQEPDNAHAYNALGYTLADLTDRHQEALQLIRKAMSLRADDPYILDSLGWVHYRLGHIHKAIAFLRQALALSDDAEIAAHLGEVLWVSGQQQRARTILRRAARQSPDNEVLRRTLERFGL